jgi:hypothetical protein
MRDTNHLHRVATHAIPNSPDRAYCRPRRPLTRRGAHAHGHPSWSPGQLAQPTLSLNLQPSTPQKRDINHLHRVSAHTLFPSRRAVFEGGRRSSGLNADHLFGTWDLKPFSLVLEARSLELPFPSVFLLFHRWLNSPSAVNPFRLVFKEHANSQRLAAPISALSVTADLIPRTRVASPPTAQNLAQL